MILIITEEGRMINFKSFREAHIQESDGKYEVYIRGLPDGEKAGTFGIQIPVITLNSEKDAEKALRDLRSGIKKGEWDAGEYKRILNLSEVFE